MLVKVVGVVGAGQMGNGIAQVAAASGLQVIMADIKEEFVNRGIQTMDKKTSVELSPKERCHKKRETLSWAESKSHHRYSRLPGRRFRCRSCYRTARYQEEDHMQPR